ncbi:TPA: fimbrial protein [Photobacterium damselae]
MKKINILSLSVLLGFASLSVQANTGTVNFNGVISAVTCDTAVGVDGAVDPTGTIFFDVAAVSDFEDGATPPAPVIGTPASGAFEKKFQIAPVDAATCSATSATITLTGTSKIGYPDVLDGGQDVGFTVKFEDDSSVLNKPNTTVEDVNWDSATKGIKLKADYFNTGVATPGSVYGSATYAIAYL